VIALALVVLPHRPSSNRPAPPPGASDAARSIGLRPEVSVAQAAELQGQGAFLVDVRQPEEFAEGHIAGSTLIPLDDLESRVAEVPRDRQVVVVCHSGNRSRHGRDILLQAGYSQVASMSGGLSAWESEGRKTVTGM
jgi:rhodanese-related sulfurtransferase